MAQPVPENISFAQAEEKILEYWKEINAFEESLRLSAGRPRFAFYDGPPFATGLPHYGHILAGTIKDVVTRYAYQKGYHVERRFGWDCHGLPIEYEIDKTLGIKSPAEVAKLGIAKYNDECRKIVMRFSTEWEAVVTRLGRWIDFKNDYKTMYPWFMESVWWVFSELWNKGLVYRGIKVMPYSTACATPLSNFESGQNYKEVVDPAVVVSFPLKSDPSVSLLAWTTTPWTLPSNLALCVNPNFTYVKIKDISSGKFYIMLEELVPTVFKKANSYEIVSKVEAAELKGQKYEPLFPYFSFMEKAFVVLADEYVTSETGTGIVHQAPYFGEDDFRICLANGIIAKDQAPICPVDASGRFVDPVKDFVGLHVKEADPKIIKHLTSLGRLVSNSTTKHNYPFCWRSETPLIYKAVPSWFIRVESFSQHLLQCNSQTYWVPDFVKEKRFGNWLKDARDWAVSRNRFWGTPIPLWASDDMEEIVCVSSIDELEKLTGHRVSDLHRENIDHLTIPSSRPGKSPLKRIPEVFDCWFESGSMPYAQQHYPFKNSEDFKNIFPADFIGEGIDQTRGWFYTLLVISTALFDKPPFKNLIANGLVLASDGQKMSKSKKNYPDPMEVINKYGSDALRLYLINSPVVRAENLKFKEEGVKDILKDVFLPWYNAYRFLIQNILRFNCDEGVDWKPEKNAPPSDNLMDRWILSFTQTLQLFTISEMAAYHLYTVVPRLVQFIDNLTNWYVRMNRRRLKGENGKDECLAALRTLTSVIYSMVSLMTPYTPFLTELMYQNLKGLVGETAKSVHFLLAPQPKPELVNEKIEKSVSKMQTVIELGRVLRDRKTIPIKYPLQELVVILNDEDSVEELKPLTEYIREELNVRQVVLSTDKVSYGVTLRAEPDHKTLGARLKGDFKAAMESIKRLSNEELVKFRETGTIKVLNHDLDLSDVRFMFSFTGPRSNELSERYETNSSNDILILLDIRPSEEMKNEGIAREIINRIQKLRKKAHLVPTDPIKVFYKVNPGTELGSIAKNFADFIENAIKASFMKTPVSGRVIINETFKLVDSDIEITLVHEAKAEPYCKYLNIRLVGIKRPFGHTSSEACVLLENPVGKNRLDLNKLNQEVRAIFNLYNHKFSLLTKNNKFFGESDLGKESEVYVVPFTESPSLKIDKSNGDINCGFVNVDYKNEKLTLLMENPKGEVFNNSLLSQVMSSALNIKQVSVEVDWKNHSLTKVSS